MKEKMQQMMSKPMDMKCMGDSQPKEDESKEPEKAEPSKAAPHKH